MTLVEYEIRTEPAGGDFIFISYETKAAQPRWVGKTKKHMPVVI
jgi:hypothetical protein